MTHYKDRIDLRRLVRVASRSGWPLSNVDVDYINESWVATNGMVVSRCRYAEDLLFDHEFVRAIAGDMQVEQVMIEMVLRLPTARIPYLRQVCDERQAELEQATV